MRIDSSVIGMESARRYTSSTTRTGRFFVKDYNGDSAHGTKEMFGNGELSAEEEKGENVGKDPAELLRDRVEAMRNRHISLRPRSQSAFDSFRQQTIRSIFAMLFGVQKADSIFGKDLTGQLEPMQADANLGQVQGNVLVVSSEQFYEEVEETSFSAQGIVRTADGREISLNLDISMSRRFTSYFKEELKVMKVETCDPLVLNFEGNAAELTDQKFFFDIDADGEEDEISMLAGGSGYLSLDKNGDGKINDGSELFGPESGNGFADLAAYDEDGNGWIDENDAIWSKLKIWCKNADGTDTLYTLKDKGVGAICLQKAATDFSLKNEKNETNGIIRNTGIFLYENGNVGTVQHLDLAQ